MPQPTARQAFIAGLRKAHAMERRSLELLARLAERSGYFPRVQAKVYAHANETRQQLLRLESCLVELDKRPSLLKDATSFLIASLAAVGRGTGSAAILKSLRAAYALESYEVAVYKSLLALAEQSGAGETAGALKTSLAEEERMAAWIGDNIAELTKMSVAPTEKTAA
jgi:ferritin-like metal-binding protein YciE